MTHSPTSRAAYQNYRSSPSYVAIMLAKNGAVIGFIRIRAQNDDHAIVRAESLMDGRVLELWDNQRFIQRFPSLH